MKKLLVVSAIAALGFTSVGFAGGLPEEPLMAPAAVTSDAGIYIGIEGGWALTNWKNVGNAFGLDTTAAVSKGNGFVGRALLGYDINRYFALEAGYSYFFNKATVTGSATNNAVASNIKTMTVDLYAKGKLPVVDNFDLFAKLGGGWMYSKYDSSNRNSINLAYGAGADYYITPNVIGSIEWLRVNGSPKADNKYQPYTDAFMLGLRYKFDL